MGATSPTELFVYGTLRHDQPEHARYCRGVTGWRRARLRGRLFRLVEGYLLLVVPLAAILHRATRRPDADEMTRRAVAAGDLAQVADALERAAGSRWIPGELLDFADAASAWPPLDRWENASTHRDSVYARVVVPAAVDDPERPLVAAWVYAASRAPAGAVELDALPAD